MIQSVEKPSGSFELSSVSGKTTISLIVFEYVSKNFAKSDSLNCFCESGPPDASIKTLKRNNVLHQTEEK